MRKIGLDTLCCSDKVQLRYDKDNVKCKCLDLSFKDFYPITKEGLEYLEDEFKKTDNNIYVRKEAK